MINYKLMMTNYYTRKMSDDSKSSQEYGLLNVFVNDKITFKHSM